MVLIGVNNLSLNLFLSFKNICVHVMVVHIYYMQPKSRSNVATTVCTSLCPWINLRVTNATVFPFTPENKIKRFIKNERTVLADNLKSLNISFISLENYGVSFFQILTYLSFSWPIDLFLFHQNVVGLYLAPHWSKWIYNVKVCIFQNNFVFNNIF